MEIIKIKGKALEKLINVTSNAIGTLYEPRKIRKNADAQAYRIEVIAEAERTKILIEDDTKFEVLERAKKRIFLQEINKQINIEEVVSKAIPHLKDNDTEEVVDKDWSTKFFQKAQDITSSNVQEKWARILANEISSPGTTSIRTMEVLSVLSKSEAEKFEILCSLVSSDNLIWKTKKQNAFDEYNIKYSDLLLLRDAGLLYSSDTLVSIIPIIPDIKIGMMWIGNDEYTITNKKSHENSFKFNQIALSVAGKELCKILNIEKNEKYIKELINEKTQHGFTLVKVIKVVSNKGI